MGPAGPGLLARLNKHVPVLEWWYCVSLPFAHSNSRCCLLKNIFGGADDIELFRSRWSDWAPPTGARPGRVTGGPCEVFSKDAEGGFAARGWPITLRCAHPCDFPPGGAGRGGTVCTLSLSKHTRNQEVSPSVSLLPGAGSPVFSSPPRDGWHTGPGAAWRREGHLARPPARMVSEFQNDLLS